MISDKAQDKIPGVAPTPLLRAVLRRHRRRFHPSPRRDDHRQVAAPQHIQRPPKTVTLAKATAVKSPDENCELPLSRALTYPAFYLLLYSIPYQSNSSDSGMIGADIAIGVVSNIVYGGLTRIVGGSLVSVQRRQAIERALVNPKDEQAKRFKQAIDDVQVIIANRFESNTKRLDDFLSELNRSAFPEVITETVLKGGDSGAAKHIFDAVIENYKTTPEFKDFPAQLFQALETAVRAQYNMLSSEGELLSSIAAKSNAICYKVDSLLKTVNEIQIFNARRNLSKPRIDEIRLKLCKQIEAKHRYITVETTRGARKYSVSKLFIEPRFTRLNYDELSIPKRTGKKSVNTESNQDAFEIGYGELRNTLRRTVILGDPGGGKSTTVQHICFEFARFVSLSIEHFERKGIDPARQRVPLRLVLRAFETRKRQNPNLSILESIIEDLQDLLNDERQEIEEFVRYSLISGTAVVLFDGLDEVLSIKTRREYVELIEQFANTFPAASIVVTSRFVGYMDAPLDPQYECLSLAEFGPEQISSYSRKSLAVIKGVKESSVDREVTSFLDQTSKNASDLRVNPLMLALMVWLYAIKGDVPANRPEIYKECATLMFERWDQNRGILFGIPSDFELIDLFGFLANEIFGRPELEEGVSKDWLFAKVKSYFSRWYEEKAKSVQVSKSLVDFLTGRAWVLSEIGADVFKFTHRTFLEYFYARYANAQIDSTVELIRKLSPRIINGEMDVVNHLSLQMFTFREPRKIQEAVSELVNLVEATHNSNYEAANAIVFFSRALEYLVMSEMQYREALDKVIRRLINVGASGETFVSIALSHCVVHAGNRIQILDQVARASFTFAVTQGFEQRGFIVSILSGGPLRRRSKMAFVRQRPNLTKSYLNLMKTAKEATLPRLIEAGQTDINHARMAIEISPIEIRRFFGVFSHEVLYSYLHTPFCTCRTAVVHLARVLSSQLSPVSLTPWIDVDPDPLIQFLSQVLGGETICAPSPSKGVARDIDLAFQDDHQYPFSYSSISMRPNALSAYLLSLAVLSQMEVAMFGQKGARSGLIQSRRDFVRRLARRYPHRARPPALDNWINAS
ncbi:NACHT domain-containing protein [Bradyrhizobium sp. HKCCYLR20261]|uniref:NACHT domain-containing protein n=1 Tax=Bradyrhizobium sp. HKCCYLR20261 TaxID=3420760 RepID=UPI003EB74D04